jgi:hypothetical protein
MRPDPLGHIRPFIFGEDQGVETEGAMADERGNE